MATAKQRRKRRTRLGGVPPIFVAEVTFRCPDGQHTIEIPGPSAAAAIKKGTQARVPRCTPVGMKLLQRGAGAHTRA